MSTLVLQMTCWNGSRYLPFLFESLTRQTRQGWEMYLLDNGSDAEEGEKIREAVQRSGLPIHLTRIEDTVNFANGHNLLFEKHDGTFVQLLNDDAFLESDYLERVLSYMESHPECAAAGGRIYKWDFEHADAPPKGRTTIIDSFGLERLSSGMVRDRFANVDLSDTLNHPITRRLQNTPETVFGISGCLPMYRRSAILATSPDKKLFDPTFTAYKEDVEVAYRLGRAGFTSVVVHDAVAYHRRSFGKMAHKEQRFETQLRSYRNHLWVLLMHLSLKRFLRDAYAIVPFELAKIMFWFGHRPKVIVTAWSDTAKEWKNLMRKRKWYASVVASEASGEAGSGFAGKQSLEAIQRPDKTTYDIAIVMVSHNDLNDACLSSLRHMIDVTPLKVQFIVADNASTKYHANEVVDKHFEKNAIVLLRNGDFGFGRSCNRGASVAEAKYLFFLNPDTILSDDRVLETLYRFLEERPKVGIAAPKVLHFDGRLQETCRRFPKWYMPIVQRTSLKNSDFGKDYVSEFQMNDYDHAHLRMIDWAQGSALFMSKALFDTLHGFDDRFWMYFEDMDLCRRSWGEGRPVYYFPNVVLQHAHGKESAKEKNLIKNILMNKMARAHIASWLKYEWKWRVQK